MSKERILGSLSYVVIVLVTMFVENRLGITTFGKQMLWLLVVITIYSFAYEHITTKLARKKIKRELDEKYKENNETNGND